MSTIIINDQLQLSPPEPKDIPAFVRYLNEKEIHERTLMIPFPYQESDGRWFIDFCRLQQQRFGHPLTFAIRDGAGALMGIIGYQGKNSVPAIAHRDEIGYWLGKPFWGRGIMTQALAAMVKYGVDIRKLKRIEAPIFISNRASEKVLLNCGFQEEGVLQKAYFRHGKFQDGKLFAFVVS